MYKREISVSIIIVLILSVLMITTIPKKSGSAQLVLDRPANSFIPAAPTYIDKTMPFEIGDVYGGYSYWSLSGGGTQGFDNIDSYVTDCDAGEFEFFGFDEFVNHSFIYAETDFEPFAGPTVTFDLVVLGYFYQKTALHDCSHRALAVTLDESGFSLVHNTGDGNTPTNTTLIAYPTPFDQADEFDISLENVGNGYTNVFINRTTYPQDFTYSGSIQTGNYDARSLYAGIGNVAYTSINAWGFWKYLTISDTILSYPSGGTGFYIVGAYIDEVYTHTFYDIDEGFDRVLNINTTVTNITLLVNCWLNSTTYGVSTVAEGANIIRHNVIVTNSNGTNVFSQTSFTYQFGSDYGDGLFYYQYSVQLDFTLFDFEVYTVVVDYEIFS